MPSFDAHANLASSLVVTPPSPATSGTSLTVTAGQGALFPAAPFNCTVCPASTFPTTVNAEIVRVTAIVGDVFTITRAQESTTAKAILTGYFIGNSITVKVLTDIENAISSGGVTSITGTANQIVADTPTGAVTLSLSATYPGQTSIVTVGTIGTGTWQGTAIADSYIASAATWNAKQPAGSYITALTGDGTASGPGSVALTLATVNSNVGIVGSATKASVVTVNAKGLVTAASESTVTPAVGSITGLGTGVATALGVNVGSAGAFITFNGALGTPSSGTVTNLTGTASININGTVGATTQTTGAFTTISHSGAITGTFTGQTANTFFDGHLLTNTTAAVAANQQYSPSLILTGQGWKTTATAASQQVDWRITNVPVQGSSTPTSNLIFSSQINGAGYTDRFTLGSGGALTSLASITTSSSVTTGAGGFFKFAGSTTIDAPTNGELRLTNNAVTGFTRLDFGGITSSFVALQSSGTTLTIGTADGGTSAGSLVVSATLSVTGHVTLEGVTSTGATGTGKFVFDTSPTLVTPALGTAASGNLGSCTVDGTNLVGFRGVPQNSQSTAYTTVLADAGKEIYHPVGDTNARTFTIDSNANVAYIIGTVLIFTNMSANNVTISITSDTLYWFGTGGTGSRTLAQYGTAAARKLTSTTWGISGTNLT